jgi:hypothetical protein
LKVKKSKNYPDEEVREVEAPAEVDTITAAFELLNRLEPLKQAAIAELLKNRESIDEKLRMLGYESLRAGRPITKRPTVAGVGGKVCPICGAIGHDRRFHRYDTVPPPDESPPKE